GNLGLRQSPVRKMAFDAALEGLAAQRYDVLVPGQSEFLSEGDFELALAKDPNVHVVCANVRRADGTRVFDTWHLHALPDGRKVALVGIVEPFAGAPPEIRVDGVDAAVRDAVRELGGRADAIVVAGSMRDETARSLGASFAELSLVAGGFTQRGSDGLAATGGAPAVFVGEYGWYVAQVEFDGGLRAARARQAWLDPAV